MSWITDKLFGLRQVFFGGSQLPERGALEFVGEGVTIEDDTVNKRTRVTIAGGGGSELITDGTPAALQQLGFRANGRPLAFASPADGYPADAYDLALLDDLSPKEGANKSPDSGALSTFWAVLFPAQSKAFELQAALVTPSQAIVGHASNYASIEFRAITGAVDPSTLLASITTQENMDELSPIAVEILNATIEPGQYVYVVINKVNSGVTLPAMYFNIRATPVLTYSAP
jgi:hypothetical protein